jgi:predicted Zn-dependent protease
MDAAPARRGRWWARRRRGVAIAAATLLAVGIVWARARDEWASHADAEAVRRAVAARRYAEAGAPLRRWLEARPGSAEAHYHRARIALGQDRPTETIAAMEKARALGYPEPSLERLRGILLARASRFGEAEPLLRRAREADPRPDPELDEARARVYLETFRLAEAAAVLESWARIAPEDPKPYLWRVEIDRRTGARPEDLERDYRAALQRDPGRDEARFGLAEALAQANRHAEAAREFDAYLARKPDDPEGHLSAGNNALVLGDLDVAIRHFDRALALAPDDPRALMARAGLDLRRGDPSAALATLDRALRLDPYEPEVRHRRALALDQLGRRDEARAEREAAARLREDAARVEQIREGLVRAPNDRALQREAARWLVDHGHAEEGARWAKRVLAADPADPDMNRLLADHYRRLGNSGLANFYGAAARDDRGR